MRVAKGREWVRRLVPALALACLITAFFAQAVLADSMTLNLKNGQPTDSIVATYTYLPPPTSGCPANQLAIDFWWDSMSFPISSALVNFDANKNCVAVLKFAPAGVKGAPTSVGNHIVLAGPGGKPAARAPYTIDPPPPPPSPSPTPTPPPSPTPTPTTPPPTTPPPTTPPPTTPTPTPPPTHRPSPIPTPVQQAAPSPSPTPATGCVVGAVSSACPSPSPTLCKQTAAVTPPTGPGASGGGLALALALFGGMPIVGVFVNSRLLMRRRELARLACLIAVAVLLVAGTSCARPLARIGTAATPTPAASVLPSPTC